MQPVMASGGQGVRLGPGKDAGRHPDREIPIRLGAPAVVPTVSTLWGVLESWAAAREDRACAYFIGVDDVVSSLDWSTLRDRALPLRVRPGCGGCPPGSDSRDRAADRRGPSRGLLRVPAPRGSAVHHGRSRAWQSFHGLVRQGPAQAGARRAARAHHGERNARNAPRRPRAHCDALASHRALGDHFDGNCDWRASEAPPSRL